MLRALVLLIAFSSLASPQGWTRVQSFAGFSGGADRIFITAPHTIWVTRGNQIPLLSKDDGRNWEIVPILRTKGGINAVHFTTPERGWAVGAKGGLACIWGTSDGGMTWKEVHVVHGGRLGVFVDVDFFDENIGVAVGGGERDEGPKSVISTTRDGGRTWSTVFIEPLLNYVLRSVRFRSQNEVFAAGGDNILSSWDGGVTWQQRDHSTNPSLSSLAFAGREKIFVTGGWGLLLESVDSGRSWRQVSLPADSDGIFLWAISFIGDRGWICGDKGSILYTTDKGQTWTLEKTRYEGFFRDVVATDEKVFVAGDGGILLTQSVPKNDQISATTPTHSVGSRIRPRR